MNEVKRYRVSYMNGVIEEDGSPRSFHDSEPMVLASAFDAQISRANRAELEREEALDAVEKYRADYAQLQQRCEELEALLRELIDIEGPCPGTAAWASKVCAAIGDAP